jgi:glycosyltransferase involved in cell wall biosynthesis
VSTVHVVLPEGVDDPGRPSGGNIYDRRICHGLAAAGWQVHEYPAAGRWPWPDAAAEESLTRSVAGLPDGALLLVDGLVASTVPAVLVPAAERLRLVVLVHLPLGGGPPGHEVADARTREAAVLSAARSVLTTSAWTRERLLTDYALRPDQVHAVTPGVDPADLAPGTAAGDQFLCVAAVTPVKGHDVLLAALAHLSDLPWRCVCVGALDRDPAFVDRLRRQARADAVEDRICWSGPRTGAGLDEAYGGADVLVLASHAETYGMVVTEGLARGLPVIASAVGGLPEALGCTPDGHRPGLLVPPGHPRALAAALRAWLSDADLRRDLRRVAAERRRTLSGWATTTERISQVLSEISQEERAA